MISTTPPAQLAERPPRILYVVNVAWFFLSHRLALAKAAVRAGYDVHVVTTITDEKERQAILAAGLQLHEVTFDRSGFAFAREFRTLRCLLALYRRLRPDLVHQVTIKPVLYGGVAARIARVPAVVNAIPGLGYSFGGSSLWARLRRALIIAGYRFVLDRANSRTIFQNIEQLQMFLDAGVVSASNAVLVRGSGVDIGNFTPSPEPQGAVTVLLAARMLREKGIFEFASVAERMRKAGAAIVFRLVGDPDEHNPGSISIEQLRAWHTSGVVEWLGFREDMAALLSQCHIACLPSYGEGLPRFLLEAAASGRAIVTTDIPGCRDIARGGVNALLVSLRDTDSLYAAIKKLADDPQMRNAFGKAGRMLVEQEFSEDMIVQQTLDVYREVTAAALNS